MIVTIPFFLPVILPELFTVATLLLDVEYVMPSVELVGLFITFQLKDFPLLTVFFVAFAVSFVVFTPSTLTFTVTFLLPDFT